MILLVCGDRDWTDASTIIELLVEMEQRYPDQLVILEGGCKTGADDIAGIWAATARSRGVGWIHTPARWHEYPPSQRWQAGHDRNTEMLEYLLAARKRGDEIRVLAFKKKLHFKLALGGTEDMLRKALKADVPCWHHDGQQLRRMYLPSDAGNLLPSGHGTTQK